MNILTRKPKAPAKVLTPAQAERQRETELIAARTAAELRELQAAEELRELDRAATMAAKVKELETKDKTQRSKEWSATVQTWTARFVPFLPLVLVNTMAVFGQLGWGRHNLTQVGSSPEDLSRWIIAALFAATLESIALFLAYYANRALDRGDSATALYLAAFGVAAIVAGVNYSHYASAETFTLGPVEVGKPTAMSIVFAMCSVASPWLWRIKHRDANRNKLHALGVIDSKAVRLSMARKIFYPFRSFQVTRLAVWEGTTNPAEAVAQWETVKAAKAARKVEEKAAKASAKEAQKATQKAEKAVEVPKAQDELPAPQEPAQPALEAPKAPQAPELPEVAQRFPGAWDVLTKTHEAGNPISQRALAANYLNGNRHHARDLIKNHTEWRMITSVNGARVTP